MKKIYELEACKNPVVIKTKDNKQYIGITDCCVDIGDYEPDEEPFIDIRLFFHSADGSSFYIEEDEIDDYMEISRELYERIKNSLVEIEDNDDENVRVYAITATLDDDLI